MNIEIEFTKELPIEQIKQFEDRVVYNVALGTREETKGLRAYPYLWLPWQLSGTESACQCRIHEFDPGSGNIPHAAEQLSPCATTTEPVLYSPGAATTKPKHCSY